MREKEFWITLIGTTAAMLTIVHTVLPEKYKDVAPLIAIPTSYIITSLII